jgi:hypothetical protein
LIERFGCQAGKGRPDGDHPQFPIFIPV